MADLLVEGIFFFNDGRYFEAHEVWEDLWRVTRGPLRYFYQGLIQAAVGMHHLKSGNLNGGRAQLMKSLEKLEQYPPQFCGLDNAKLIGELRHTVSELVPSQILIARV